jgi:PKD repeat protein
VTLSPGTEEDWCDVVTSHVGAGYPFEVLAGNHESNGENGHINDFAACLPNQLPRAVGTYGRQYYVDVPTDDPIVRFIMISPGLTFPNGMYSYTSGFARYLWTAQAIDTARAAAIPWVVVGMHKPCITMGVYACDPGEELFNLLLTKKVDLILSCYEHSYQRSKQIGLGQSCSTLVGSYDSDCVVDSDSTYAQGVGSVAAIVGTGGRALYSVGNGDPETPYFAASSGSNSNPTYGVLDVTATDTSLEASFVRGAGGTFTDSFTMSRSPNQNVPPVASFSSSCTELVCSFDGSASADSDGSITGYAWDFGDGSTGTGATTTHTYAAAGSYTVGLTVTDAGSATGSTSKNVTPTAPPTSAYVFDQFIRTVTSGLGTAPTGGAWTTTGSPSNVSVSGGTGNLRVAVGSGIGAYLASVSAPSTDLRLSFGLDKVPTGGAMYVSSYGRRIVGQARTPARSKWHLLVQ